MVRRTRSQFQNVVVAAVIVATVALLAPGPSGADHMTVTAVQGSAVGYQGEVSLFDVTQIGPTPIVTLPANGAEQIATVATALVRVEDTATILTTDAITVETRGTLGPNGSVTSEATLTNVGQATTQPTETGGEVLKADSIYSTCTASEATPTGDTLITNGFIRTDSGFDANNDGDVTDVGDLPEVFAPLPADPAPGQEFTGIVRFSGSGTPTSFDTFTIRLNEQIIAGNTITVNAVHIFYADPGTRLDGELILGQVVCGVTLQALPPTTTTTVVDPTTTTTQVNPTTTTTQVNPTTTTTQVNPTTTTTQVNPTTTTTQVNPTTTTTQVNPTTTTTVAPGTTTTVGTGFDIGALIRSIVCPILERLARIPLFRAIIVSLQVRFGCPTT